MRLRLKKNYKEAREELERAEANLEGETGVKKLADARASLNKAKAEVKRCEPKAIEISARKDKEKSVSL